MTTATKRTMALICLVFAAGCVTDDLAVFDDSKLDKDDLKPYVGEYRVQHWPGNDKPERIRVSLADDGLRFAYTISGRDLDARFIVSKIPNSKENLHLLSLPAQESTNQASLFFIGKAEKDETRIWAVFNNSAVARDHLSFQNGKVKSDDVKRFLSMNADDFVSANDTQVVLANPQK